MTTPAETVGAYVDAVRRGDLVGLSRCYTPPLDQVCLATAKFNRAHGQLLLAVEKKWGKSARHRVDVPPYKAAIRLIKVVRAEAMQTFIKDGRASVVTKLVLKGRKKPVETVFNLRRIGDSWRIWGVNGRALGVASDAHSYRLEWSVREEATARTLDRIHDGACKSVDDVVLARNEYVKIITRERLLQRRLKTPPKSENPKPPGKKRPDNGSDQEREPLSP